MRDGTIACNYMDDKSLATDLHLHPSIIQGQAHIRCFTTPAPTDRGRDEPRHNRQHISPQARQRWLQDNRQYAPWHYETVNMVQPKQNQPLRMLTNDEKERIHHIPLGYTAQGTSGQVSERDRGRIIGNGWHLGIARMFMTLALLAAHFPLADTRSLHPDGPTLMSRLCTWYTRSSLPAGPPGKLLTTTTPSFDCPDKHIQFATTYQHPMALLQPMDPTLHFALAVQCWVGHDIIRIRKLVVEELQTMLEDMQEETDDWHANLTTHVQQAYTIKETNKVDKIVQVPAFVQLLKMTNYPKLHELQQDLYTGFEMLGPIHEGVNWHQRSDGRYSTPTPLEEFYQQNKTHFATDTPANTARLCCKKS